ncbi:MAG: hypothetical protein ACYTFI_01980 [Planctomycetota bacterium]|jgi:hypothetical protein
MTGREFMNAVANGRTDVLAVLLRVLEETGSEYCVIGGLAVNAYAEPVVSLDLDIVVAMDAVERVRAAAEENGFAVEAFEHSVNLKSDASDFRIQLQTDPRYQDFIARAGPRDVLGYRVHVAAIEDVLQGKVWAYSDSTRRKSKRQKDLADIMRLVEARPELARHLPEAIRGELG